ncbi:hypothetical protein [Streptomyces hoynatensis]|uniref:hypothetical protein n=1 Tax=Streptomyces hoynatensis TaxID=1141874 RepID=UPI001F4D4858|nr:hypothetical protein [Streptomyces hoynatensis]
MHGLALPACAPLIIAASAGAYALLEGDAHLTRPGTLDHPLALIAPARLAGA